MKTKILLTISIILLATFGTFAQVIMDELNGSTLGNASGITYTATPNGQGAVFSRTSESRIEYPFSMGLPHQGTIEMEIKVTKGYSYNNYTLQDNQSSAIIFTTVPIDVWYVGAMWFSVDNLGNVWLSTSTAYGQPDAHSLNANGTPFRFNEWHVISFSYGSQGQYIKVDGKLVASNPNYTETLQACGDFNGNHDIPTVGEGHSIFWGNNQYDQGFEGVLDRFRASDKQQDWVLEVSGSSSLAIKTPNGGENWKVGTVNNITWTSNKVTNVKLEYSTDNGASWIPIIASTPASNGSYEWTIPNTPSTQCKVKIMDVADSTITAVSASSFTIDLGYSSATIGTLKNGPSENVYSIPENGTGYVYFSMVNAAGQPVANTSSFNVTLSDQANRKYHSTGLFIKPGVLRIAIPGSQLTASNGVSNTITIQDSIQIGDMLYKLSSATPTFNIEKVQQEYTRTFDFFADGSAGMSGSVGSVGLGPSIAMAKISITGTAGIGLRVTVDPDNNLTLSRRFDAGIATDIEIPSVNTVVGKVSAGIGEGISSKTIESQEISLSGIQNITPDQVTMTQAGFVLETLSMGIGNFSPTLTILLKSIKQRLFISNGITQALKDALIRTSWGIENEGTISAGFNADWGIVKFDLASGSMTGILSGQTNNYHKGLPSIGNATLSNSISKAANFDFSLLKFSFASKDGVSLGSNNLGLFDNGTGMETGAEAFLNSSNQLQRLNLWLDGGGSLSIFGGNQNRYYKTVVEIPGEYRKIVLNNDFAVNGLISSTGIINIQKLTQNVPAIIDSVSNNFIQTPITIRTYENNGDGKSLFLGVDLDAALGVGFGVKFGVDLKYYNELSYLKKYSLVYAKNNNYLMSSANYSNQMNSYQLSTYLTSLIQGTAGIIKSSFLNIWSSVNKMANSGENFILNGVNKAGNFVGSIQGNIQKTGQWFIHDFSPNFKHLWNKSFAEPVVQNLYYSTKVQHKETYNNKSALVNVATTMVAVSDDMKINFIPDGQSVSVDSIDSTFTIKMVIDTAKLRLNGFTLADSFRIKIYRYNDSNGNWIMVGGTLHGDTLEATVKYMANYLLGIELTDADDKTAPTIVDYGPKQDSTFTSYPMIYAKIQDNQYGVGVNWDKTFLIANGDTLNASFDPTNQEIFYDLSEKDSLAGKINIKVWTEDYNGNSDSINFSIYLTITGVNEQSIANGFKLSQNYPNPFSYTTKINYSISKASNVKVIIFNSTGGYIATLELGRQAAGSYSVNFNGEGLPSGIYFYSFIAIPIDGSAAYRETRKMSVLSYK